MTPPSERAWWRDAVVYQVYPRSFADASGDGIGDLPGLLDRVPYLARLGVDAVWLSPFYPSPLADGGYDVADHRAVDPRLGTLEDVDRLVEALHAEGIRVMVDIVPNHTSDRHAWFQAALAAAPGSAERARYHFRDGRGPRGDEPPNDWPSVFGGPAWTRVADGQWYLHVFAPEQPDLNWANPEVRADMLATLRFWADRGVDGFRVDVAHGLTKDLSQPSARRTTTEDRYDTEDGDREGDGPLWDRDEVQEVYAGWRALFDAYDPPRVAVAEAWVPAHRLPRYASTDGLGMAFDFGLLQAPWDAAAFRDAVREHEEQVRRTGCSSTWVLANHDVVRQVSRYATASGSRDDAQAWLQATPEERTGALAADPARGLRRARAAALLLLALPGAAFLYQGEELGLPEVADLPDEVRQDPIFGRTGGARKGRDGCRVPLPWTADGPSLGFGPDGTHLPQPPGFADLAVDRQEQDPASTLCLYRRALALRRALAGGDGVEVRTGVEVRNGGGGPAPDGGALRLVDVVHLARPGGWHSVTNVGTRPVPLPAGEVLLASGPLGAGTLPGETTVWLRVEE